MENKKKWNEVKRHMENLTPDQLDRLSGFFQVVKDNKNGTATDESVMRYILNLPKEDIIPFTEIMSSMKGAYRRSGACL